MSAESMLFFSIMAVASFISLSYGIVKMKKSREFSRALLQSIGLNFLLLGAGSVWWFFTASDGFSQVFGIMYYGITFLIISFTVAICLLIIRKNTAEQS